MMVPSFTAVTDCPKCGTVDIHWIEEAKPAPTPEELIRIAKFHLPIPGWDDRDWICARVCTSCNHRWGMK